MQAVSIAPRRILAGRAAGLASGRHGERRVPFCGFDPELDATTAERAPRRRTRRRSAAAIDGRTVPWGSADDGRDGRLTASSAPREPRFPGVGRCRVLRSRCPLRDFYRDPAPRLRTTVRYIFAASGSELTP